MSNTGTALVVALVGFLSASLGVVLTSWFQRRNAERAERQAKVERMRQDRMAVYSEYAGAIIELRRAQLDKWFNREDDQRRADARRARAAAWHQYYRVRLIADDPPIVESAKEAIDAASSLDDAASRQVLNEDADRLRDELVAKFIREAERQVGVSASARS